MTIIAWGPEYSFGIKTLDDDHKRLIELVNELEFAMLLGNGSAIVGRTVEELLEYCRTHFAKEEQYMRKFHYPSYAAHKQEHEKFLGKVEEFHAKVVQGHAAISTSVLFTLRDWLQHHLLVTDRAYVEHFKAHGLAE